MQALQAADVFVTTIRANVSASYSEAGAVIGSASSLAASSSAAGAVIGTASSLSSDQQKDQRSRDPLIHADANTSISTDDMDRILSPSEDSSCFPSSSLGGSGGLGGGLGGARPGSGDDNELRTGGVGGLNDSNFSEDDDLMGCSSADSIIRRVEEEIANAKKASQLAKSRMDNSSISNLNNNSNNHVNSPKQHGGHHDALGLEDDSFGGRLSDDSMDENAVSDSEPSVDMLDILDIKDSEDDENRNHHQYHHHPHNQYHSKYPYHNSNNINRNSNSNGLNNTTVTMTRRPQSPPEDDYFQGAMDMIGAEFDTPSPSSSPSRHKYPMADEKKVDDEQQGQEQQQHLKDEAEEQQPRATLESTPPTITKSFEKSFETAASGDYEDFGLLHDDVLQQAQNEQARPPPKEELNKSNSNQNPTATSLTIGVPPSASSSLLSHLPVSPLLEATASAVLADPPVEDSSCLLETTNSSFVTATDLDGVNNDNSNTLKSILSNGSGSRSANQKVLLAQQQLHQTEETVNAGRRARAILDTLKSRREHFSSTFRSSKSVSSPKSCGGDDSDSGFLDDANTIHNSSSRISKSGSPPVVLSSSPPVTRTMIGADGDGLVRGGGCEETLISTTTVMPTTMMTTTMTTTTTSINNKVASATTTFTALPLRRGEEGPSSMDADEKKEDDCSSKATSTSISEAARLTVTTTASPLNKRVVSLPSPDKKKFFKNRPKSIPAPVTTTTTPTASSSSAAGTGEDRKKSQVEEAFCRKSRRIRFRDPFPVLKPATRPRDAKEIIASHAVSPPQPLIRWLRPKSDLKQLIVAVMGASVQRRSNACGALKVLTQNKKNQMMLMRTDSFLESLVFAASQDIPSKDRELALDARCRAVSCLRNVCEPKDNRGYLILHPGFKEVLCKVIRDDRMEARVIACGAFALLARAPECREPMVQAEGLVDLLAEVMSGALDKNQKVLSSSSSLHADETPINATLSEGSHAGTAALTRDNNLIRSKHSSTSGPEGEHEDEDDEDDHSDGSDDNSSRSSDYSSSESEDEEEDSDHPPSPPPRSRRSQLPPRSARSPTSERKAHGTKADSAKLGPSFSLPSHAGDLVQLNSIRQINQEMQVEFLQQARSNACAALLHLSKHCATSHRLCSNACLLENLLAVAREDDNPIHTKCLEIISNLTRFPANPGFLTRFNNVVETLVAAADSNVSEDRTSALRALQNMSADSSSKTLLASESVLSAMSSAALRRAPDEKEAAVAFLYNVSTEPGAVVSITNTKNVVATLVHLAHHPESASHIRLMACDALATISLWLQTLAGTGKVPADVMNVSLPSQKTTGWDRWE